MPKPKKIPKFESKPKVDEKPIIPDLPVIPTPNKESDVLTDYTVITAEKVENLIVFVRAYIREDWQPIGGATYCYRMGRWYQTLIKRGRE